MAKKKTWFKGSDDSEPKVEVESPAVAEVPVEEKQEQPSNSNEASDLKKHPKFAKFKNEESL